VILKDFRSHARGMDDVLNYALYLDDRNVVLQKDGSFLATWRYAGPDMSAASHDELAILAAWGISILPAILSMEPADRRMAMVFPFSHVAAGTALAAFLALVHERGGRIAEALATAVAAVGVAVCAITNQSSHLLLPINPILFSDYPRFTRPLFEQSDAIFTNIPPAFRTFSVFGNLDHFLADPICVQAVEGPRWLAAALDPRCGFDDPVWRASHAYRFRSQ